MPLAIPIPQASLGDVLQVESVVWQLAEYQEMSGLGGGEWLAADLAPRLWEGEVSLKPLPHTEARAQAAKLDALDGAINSFYLANPLGWYPQRDPGGLIYGTSTPTIHTIAANRKELRITGLPNNYLVKSGDMFSVDYGSPSRRALHRVVGDAVAISGLTALIEIRPHLRPGITTTMAVNFAKPAAKVKLIPGSVTQQMHSVNRTRISFRVRQTLAAG